MSHPRRAAWVFGSAVLLGACAGRPVAPAEVRQPAEGPPCDQGHGTPPADGEAEPPEGVAELAEALIELDESPDRHPCIGLCCRERRLQEDDYFYQRYQAPPPE